MLNKKWVFDLSKQFTPQVEVTYISDMLRHEIVKSAEAHSLVGIELGVAKGIMSKRMVDSEKFITYYGVDLYGDTHDTEEYKNAIKYVGLESNFKLLRMTFDDALGLFNDAYFDYIYIDGFAHTGEEGGKTLSDWYSKLKIGGVLAGDDYHNDWPLVKWAVNDFCLKADLKLYVTEKVEDVEYCKYPSWFVIKNKDIYVEPDEMLMKVARVEKVRIFNERMNYQNRK
ncbi:class I SAM-dependent methyltransferase [Citrobacter braakii]|uniref:class I SAM-dependent methyltransferase n=1 Tax=Citrobacter europaeus TaxID=1914243 RepID=UPI001560A809|nr:class I SAM-dependent methyltransferase [Citrobacter braakii]